MSSETHCLRSSKNKQTLHFFSVKLTLSFLPLIHFLYASAQQDVLAPARFSHKLFCCDMCSFAKRLLLTSWAGLAIPLSTKCRFDVNTSLRVKEICAEDINCVSVPVFSAEVHNARVNEQKPSLFRSVSSGSLRQMMRQACCPVFPAYVANLVVTNNNTGPDSATVEKSPPIFSHLFCCELREIPVEKGRVTWNHSRMSNVVIFPTLSCVKINGGVNTFFFSAKNLPRKQVVFLCCNSQHDLQQKISVQQGRVIMLKIPTRLSHRRTSFFVLRRREMTD